MIKIWIPILLLVCFAGCSVPTSYETVEDVYSPLTIPETGKVHISLPEDAAVLTGGGTEDKLYFGDGYEILLETRTSGDLDRTLADITGYERDKLTVFELAGEEYDRYYSVWTAAGEMGDMIGKCMILDDGNYHYCLSVITPAETTEQLQQMTNAVFASYSLESY